MEIPPEVTPLGQGSSEGPENPDPAERALESRRGPWGFWATLGWTLLLGIAATLAQAVLVVGFVVRLHLRGEPIRAEELEADGTLLSLGAMAGLPVVLAGCWFLAWLRRGPPVREYLGLIQTPPRTVFRWSLVLLGFMVLADGANALIGRPLVPEFMVKAYDSAASPILIWLGIVVAAPIAEEFLFRGFMFKGLQESRLGSAGAIFLTSICWSVIHLQYDVFQIAVIFVGGLLFGYIRWVTGSIYPTIILHALQNAVATIQVAILVRMLP